ncbi:MAG: ABC transporter permease, partial [Clostridia bacterium]|nr:ABC transporter permease [Clostridia bacterium]
MRMTKASMLEVLGSDYIRMARSKGVKERSIIMKHAFRNAQLTVITVIGQGFISALAGAAVVEQLFNIPGIGSLMVNSIEKRDYQTIQAITLLVAMLNVLINLIIDLIYGWADPRIRLND